MSTSRSLSAHSYYPSSRSVFEKKQTEFEAYLASDTWLLIPGFWFWLLEFEAYLAFDKLGKTNLQGTREISLYGFASS
jgi:hypothetical protein